MAILVDDHVTLISLAGDLHSHVQLLLSDRLPDDESRDAIGRRALDACREIHALATSGFVLGPDEEADVARWFEDRDRDQPSPG